MTEGWRADARCADHEPELFFPNPAKRDQVLRAVGVCLTCPVMAACDEWATDTRQAFGVWGGKLRDHVPAAERPQPGQHGGSRPRGRQTHCRQGLHEMTPDNLYTSRKPGGRVCHTCKACALARAASRKANA